MDLDLASGYKSRSQIARVLSESWFDKNMYCPACLSDEMKRLQNNTKVLDFICPFCHEPYQLKAQSKTFGNSVINSEYYTKIRKIKAGEAPNWSLLEYNLDENIVKNLLIIPRHFLTLNIIQKRNPLSDSARRAGWTGSNVLIGRLPPDAKLYVVKDEKEVSQQDVRRLWKRFEFMKKRKLSEKGWINDVLSCVRDLGKEEFTIQEMYDFENRLSMIHPRNKHIKPKIRQQLQFLRNEGVIQFKDRGSYKII